MLKIEKLLREYNEIKCKIKLLEIEIDDGISLGSKSDNPIPGRVSVRTNISLVERQARDIESIQSEIRELRKIITKIDEVLKELTKEEYDLIKLRYFDNITMYDLSIRCNVEISTLYKRNNVILNRLENFSKYIRK